MSRFTEEERQAISQQNQALTNALLSPPQKTTPTTYIAMAPNYWGKGATVEEAKKELKKAGGTLTQYIVFQLPPGAEDAFVDQLGTVRWTWAEGADKTQESVIVAKRGTKK
jgi:hypothetical protein